jgi:glycosyltransferase involved in cell wall biosynthesis
MSVAVSVLVPTLNEERDIDRTIAGLRAQRLDRGAEFLVIDGRSSDATRDLLAAAARDEPRLRVLDNPSGDIPSALNIGLGAARGEFVARMDAHTLYPDDYLATGIARLERGDVTWVSGPQIPYGIDTWSRRIALALSTRLGIGGAKFRNAREEIDVDAGYTGVWRRRTLEALGGWDESWPINEDGELAARVLERGGRIVCVPSMGARYIPRNSLESLARQYFRYGHYRAKTCRRHPESMRRSQVLPPALVLTALVAASPAASHGPARVARPALVAYAAALLASAASVARRASLADAAAVPLVLAVMHSAWGCGFLSGACRFGVPLAALAGLGSKRSSRR